MFRKLVLALGATTVIGATALTPTAASAKHWHHYWFNAGIAIYPSVYAAPECCLVKRVYWTNHVKHVRYEEVRSRASRPMHCRSSRLHLRRSWDFPFAPDGGPLNPASPPVKLAGNRPNSVWTFGK